MGIFQVRLASTHVHSLANQEQFKCIYTAESMQ